MTGYQKKMVTDQSSDFLATIPFEVVSAGVEPATHGFSVHCSTT